MHAPWPDLPLRESYREIFDLYRRLCGGGRGCSQPLGVHRAFDVLCRSALPPCADSQATDPVPVEIARGAVRAAVERLRIRHPEDWLQRFASILGMLMHFDDGGRTSGMLVNRRRPGKAGSTYPTSPAVVRLLAEATLAAVMPTPVPASELGPEEAEQFFGEHLAVRVLDPSMESGQLLLAVAQALARRIRERHETSSAVGRYLLRAGLRRLSREVLWGLDRNELATVATRTLFALLGSELGLSGLAPRNLLTADALRPALLQRLPRFDAVINNPPWGEAIGSLGREELRKLYSTPFHHVETYVVFTELAQRSLREGGAFALVLPGQAIASSNAAGLRELLVQEARLDEIVMLPRAAFVDATVRGVVLLGRAGGQSAGDRSCRVTAFTLDKRLSAIAPPRIFDVGQDALRRRGRRSWWPLLMADRDRALEATVTLGKVARVVLGVQLYRRGRGSPRQTGETVRRRPFSFSQPIDGALPAVRGKDVRPLSVCEPTCWIRLGSWLAFPGDHARLRFEPRIFVRELCRRDGRLRAAAGPEGWIPLHGVLTVIPQFVDLRVFLAVLNSTQAADWVRSHAASFAKVDFQKITLGELRRLPVPVAAVMPDARSVLGLPAQTERERSCLDELVAAVEEAMSGFPGDPGRVDLDPLVAALFEAGATS